MIYRLTHSQPKGAAMPVTTRQTKYIEASNQTAFTGAAIQRLTLNFSCKALTSGCSPEKHDKGKGVKKIEPVEHEGDEARPDKGQDVPPPAIFGERDHEGEPREEIPRKQQRGIERPHRQSDCGNRAGHGGKRYFIG